jgi:predicted O-methyltransferase YrrM
MLGAMFNSQVNAVMDKVEALRDQVDDHWQIPRDEARVLAQLIHLGQCQSICEIGTSYGFSTLHLAAATKRFQGHVHAFDISEKKITAATNHLTEAGLIDCVTLHLGDARESVSQVEPAQPYDFVFIDAIKDQSMQYFEAVSPKFASRVVVVTDNTTTHWEQLASFVQFLRQLPGANSCAVPVGNGFEFTVLER